MPHHCAALTSNFKAISLFHMTNISAVTKLCQNRAILGHSDEVSLILKFVVNQTNLLIL